MYAILIRSLLLVCDVTARLATLPRQRCATPLERELEWLLSAGKTGPTGINSGAMQAPNTNEA